MFELYLDSANLEQINRLNQCLPLTGITTNPSILAQTKIGAQQVLTEASAILGPQARFHVQVVSQNPEVMLHEARHLHALEYDIVVKIPTTENGLSVIKQLKMENIPVLATAIYTAQQGFMAALCGADYLAPYVNRIAMLGMDAIAEVERLQKLLDKHQLPSKILAASFKNTRQAMDILQLGVGAITLPIDIAEQMFSHPAIQPAVNHFEEDWQRSFGEQLSFNS